PPIFILLPNKTLFNIYNFLNVDAVFPLFSQVQRPPGPLYTTHEINKGHPNLAATPPGHASSPGLSQVSVSTISTAHLYHPKGWEAGGGSPYTLGQNAGTTPLVYSSPTQPMNAQPQSRPFAPGPRPTHHQFFQRTQMQAGRSTIPSNNPSIRPTSQTPTAAVYPPNQPIMMTMAPMPFHSPQTAQYYIPQYRHSAPQYVGPPQQFPVQPTGPSTFYAGPSPGDFPAPYGEFSNLLPDWSAPCGLQEKKTIRIRDPNQGGKDVTEEILSGVGGSRNPTPPVGRPSSTPTPPQVRQPITETKSNTKTHMLTYRFIYIPLMHFLVYFMAIDDKPKLEFASQRFASPGLRQPETPLERRDPSSPVQAPSPPQKTELPPSGPESASSVAIAPTPSIPASTVESSVEKNGKKQYDRDFLLGFQFMPACVQKPEGLPPISDVVLDKINQNKLPMRSVDPRVISRGPDFTPAFADFGRQIPGGRGAPLLNVSLRRPPGRKIITNVSVNDEVQLRTTENAWKPGMKRENVIEDPETLTTQELFRKVRSILNKLTPQMFNQLMKQVTDLTIDTEERLKGVIDLVFEKAIDEPSFSVAYGNMCSCLAMLKVPMTDKPSSTVNFRKLLLNRCQKEFEKDKVDDDVFEKKHRELEAATSASERERLQEELEEAKDKARRRSIGNIKFIGELFKLRMLTEAIMHDCVVKLLKNHDEESLECLCRLLTTIGKDLDFEKAKPRMDQYFNQMEKIVKERKTSSRIRFMLQDVIDLRLHNWVSRRADLGPKTIEQIHKEAKLEEQEEQRKVHQQLLSKDNKRRPGQKETSREETWSTVPMTKNSRTIDPAKIPKISKPTIDEKIQLGPRAQVNWMKGSSGGAGAKASESDVSRPSASLNRYSPLQPSAPLASSLPSTSPDFDARRVLSSRGSSGRERIDRPLSAGPARTGPISLGSSNKEAPEESVQEVSRRDSNASDTPKLHASTADKSRLERSQSRESAVKLEVLSGPSPDKPTLTEEDMERRSKSIIDEFLHINDYKEAVQCVEELEQPAMLYVFVRVGVESTLERSQITRDHMGRLLYQLLQAGILHKLQFFKGFSETLELADDMAIDIPHIWLYLAELVTPVLREGGISMRELFSEFSKPLLPVGRAGILFSEILHLLCKQMSHRKVGSLWRDSGLSWADFLPETEDVHSFITEHKLDFTLSDGSNLNEAVSKRTLSPEELNKQLEKLLLEDMAGDERIFDWVEVDLLSTVRMSNTPILCLLSAAEGSSYKVDLSIIQRRLPVLHKYLNSDTERQLQALYALQALIVKLDQPANLLRMFFDCLYDEDVISEDAFYKWEVSKDPAEQQGKGVALKSVTAFFTWLREAEEESEDN
uniref:Eukaryotic translation initiation factor 4 gamma, 3b n=1 Tax=Cyprinus carpio TaxID=7962 RepID=A0A8C2BFA6_CYPCA